MSQTKNKTLYPHPFSKAYWKDAAGELKDTRVLVFAALMIALRVAMKLVAIPLAIAGWCRYLLGVDDQGNAFERSSDPMLAVLTEQLSGVEAGKPESYQGQLKNILSNANIFGVDLYQAGIGSRVEEMFVEQLAGPGAVRATLKKYLGE